MNKLSKTKILATRVTIFFGNTYYWVRCHHSDIVMISSEGCYSSRSLGIHVRNDLAFILTRVEDKASSLNAPSDGKIQIRLIYAGFSVT